MTAVTEGTDPVVLWGQSDERDERHQMVEAGEDRYTAFLTALAGVVIVALTAGSFWLSYAHLHMVADQHGLGGSPVRAWAWPGCLDLFTVAGELLMVRAALARQRDDWAIALVVIGSGGSIALNVLGVDGKDPLAYVVAGVPPTAALLAFGALMRQVHSMIVRRTELYTRVCTPTPEVYTRSEGEPPAEWFTQDDEDEGTSQDDEASVEEPRRLSTEQANAAMEKAWRDGLSVREAAGVSTRSPSRVQQVYSRLDSEYGPRPRAGEQLQMAGGY